MPGNSNLYVNVIYKLLKYCCSQCLSMLICLLLLSVLVRQQLHLSVQTLWLGVCCTWLPVEFVKLFLTSLCRENFWNSPKALSDWALHSALSTPGEESLSPYRPDSYIWVMSVNVLMSSFKQGLSLTHKVGSCRDMELVGGCPEQMGSGVGVVF